MRSTTEGQVLSQADEVASPAFQGVLLIYRLPEFALILGTASRRNSPRPSQSLASKVHVLSNTNSVGDKQRRRSNDRTQDKTGRTQYRAGEDQHNCQVGNAEEIEARPSMTTYHPHVAALEM